jgi:hypothetical protein
VRSETRPGGMLGGGSGPACLVPGVGATGERAWLRPGLQKLVCNFFPQEYAHGGPDDEDPASLKHEARQDGRRPKARVYVQEAVAAPLAQLGTEDSTEE